MTLITVRQLWSAYLQKEYESYQVMLTDDIFEHWDESRHPEWRAEAELRCGLKLLYARDPNDMEARYFRRALAVLDRIDQEHLLEEPRYRRTDIAYAQGNASAIRTYCEALLGQSFRKDRLPAAGRGCMEWALFGSWNEIPEYFYLRGVRMLLLGDDAAGAREALKVKRRFKFQALQKQILDRLAAADAGPLDDRELLAEFDDLFNVYRIPNPQLKHYNNPDNDRFELGLLRDKYFDSPDGAINVPRAIETISQ